MPALGEVLMNRSRPHDPSQPKGRFLTSFIKFRKRIAPTVKPWLIRRPSQWLLDGLCGATSLVLAYLLRFDFAIPQADRLSAQVWAGILFVVTPVAFSLAGGRRATWQFFGHRDFVRLAIRALPITLVMFFLRAFLPGRILVPYSAVVMDYVLVLCMAGSIRMMRRLEHELALRQAGTKHVLIIGTTSTLTGAIRQLQPMYGQALKGIVVDDDSLHKMRVAGIPVLGQSSDLRAIVATHHIDLLFLCSTDFPNMAEIIRVASDLEITVKLLPSPQDLIDNKVRVSRNLTVDAIDSRDRNASSNISPVVVQCLSGRTVLVTGAGGSIGSEIVRQVSSLNLKKLIVLDNNENSIFELLNELGRRPGLIPVIADIRNRDTIRHLFATERPDVVLHAAAYKHVPMMELNPCESVTNNVAGTSVLVQAALEFYSERLVMISSDKAVHPSSVMGATKRVAEIVVQDQASKIDDFNPRTHFACVRFGNVLGSRGSVLPIFLRQIANGGPVTVTHEDMTRYFMTIPQAVRLVLEAATLASSGDVYMLDMGDPVRIMDFARELIELSGLVLGKDIEIQVVGTRPGEKLHEQLWTEDAHVVPTEFAHVFRVRAPKVDPSFSHMLKSLVEAAQERRPDDVLSILHSLPIHFLTEQNNPIAAVLKHI
jgi:FlaA1/EpsC-like NDP-sugar epimerase